MPRNWWFDVRIFTLNQDLLLERAAARHPRIRLQVAVPYGMGDGRSWPSEWTEPDQLKTITYTLPMDGEVKLLPSLVPHAERSFHLSKLHGSIGWRSANDLPVIVTGQNKAEALNQSFFSVLYRGLVDRCRRDCGRLIVVGYSFRDRHVNEAISGVVESAGGEIEVYDVIPLNRWYEAVTRAPGLDSRLIMRLSRYSSRGVEEFLTKRVPELLAESS